MKKKLVYIRRWNTSPGLSGGALVRVAVPTPERCWQCDGHRHGPNMFVYGTKHDGMVDGSVERHPGVFCNKLCHDQYYGG